MKKVLLSLFALAAMLITPTLADATEFPVLGTGTTVQLAVNKNVKCAGKRYGIGTKGTVIAHRIIKDANGKPKLDQFGRRQQLYRVQFKPCPKGKYTDGLPRRWITRVGPDARITHKSEIPALIAEYLDSIGQGPHPSN